MRTLLSDRWRTLWLPALVFSLGSAVALGVWGRLITERREQVVGSARTIAAESRAAIAVKLTRHLSALEDLAEAWGRFDRDPLPEWAEEADRLMRNVPGFRYVAWVSSEAGRTRVAHAAGRESARIPDESVARAHAAAPAIAGPEPLDDGSFGYDVYLPVANGRGVLAAGVSVSELLLNPLQDSAPGYAISIAWGGREILARGQPVRDAALGWWRAEGELPLAFGTVWRVVHAPTPELARATLGSSPHVLLAGGVLLSAAGAFIAHQLLLARRSARELAVANQALGARVREASESAAVLRRLSEELERRVAARTRELEGAMSELEAFNYSVSHDLRSPLGAILNFVAILEEDHLQHLERGGAEVLARIRGSTERALALLEGLLALSRASRAKLELEDLDMGALVREAFVQARVARGERDVELELGPLPPARGDRALIADVLANLFDNALKYSRGREKRRVVVSGRADAAEILYSVSDNGVGFDARFAGKLFGVFERLHPREQFEGTGVGLAMVARIVHRHGGRVWAESRPQQGACFFFSLPHAGGAAP